MSEDTDYRRSQWRATFEDTKKAQKQLRLKLDELISGKRCVKDNIERSLLLDELIPDALLGEGSVRSHLIHFKDGGAGYFDNIEYWFQKICYVEESVVPAFTICEHQVSPLAIDEVWRLLRDEVFLVFPLARKKAASMSKERDTQRERNTIVRKGYNGSDDRDI